MAHWQDVTKRAPKLRPHLTTLHNRLALRARCYRRHNSRSKIPYSGGLGPVESGGVRWSPVAESGESGGVRWSPAAVSGGVLWSPAAESGGVWWSPVESTGCRGNRTPVDGPVFLQL